MSLESKPLKTENSNISEFEGIYGPVVSRYIREDQFDDGSLIDITEFAQAVGLLYPVALTRAAYQKCVEWNESRLTSKKFNSSSEDKRRLDIANFLLLGIKASVAASSELEITVEHMSNYGDSLDTSMTKLKARVGPGDTSDPVITIDLSH